MFYQHKSYQQNLSPTSFSNRTFFFLTVIVLFASCNILEQPDPAPYGFEKTLRGDKISYYSKIYSTQKGFDIITNFGKDKLIITIDGSGNEIARKIIPLEQSTGWYSTIQTRSGDYVLIGHNFETEKGFGLRINKSGEVVWKKNYDEFSGGRAIAEFVNGNIIINSSRELCIIDEFGQIIKSVNSGRISETIQILPNGNFVFPHFTQDSILNNYEDVMMSEYDQELNLVKTQKYFDASRKFYFINVRYLSDSTLIFFGTKQKEKKVKEYDHPALWVSKVTLSGEILWEKEVYHMVNQTELYMFTDISISENTIALVSSSMASLGGKIFVLDMYGNKQYEITRELKYLYSLTKIGSRGNICLGSGYDGEAYLTTVFY